MSLVSNMIRSFTSPRLYAIYSSNEQDPFYKPNFLEKWGDNILSVMGIVLKMGTCVSPLIGIHLYRSGLLTAEGFPGLMRFSCIFGVTMIACIVVRAIGRGLNGQYQEFVDYLALPASERRTSSKHFDYDFSLFPVSYVATKGCFLYPDEENKTEDSSSSASMKMLAAVAVRVFGLRLIYPGSLAIIHNLMWPKLIEGRRSLILESGGVRHKVMSADGNAIDCMVVDRRGAGGAAAAARGGTLVVCCEGNAGYYEVGIACTPLEKGFSVLGWNHPGFGGSTGQPYPEQERNAVLAMMEFAVDKLGFRQEEIVVFGWSIGGYTAAYAASKYPKIKCLVLDATFDSLVPLAQARMPGAWAALVRAVVERHVRLNVGELAASYPGDFRIVRRVHDEIIAIQEGDLSTNCANPLVLRLLEARAPGLAGDDVAAVRAEVADLLSMREGLRGKVLEARLNTPDPLYRTVFTMLNKHVIDYKSTHCTPLPPSLFTV